MASLLEVKNGTTALLPTTSWAAPNGLFGASADRNDGSIYGWSDSTSTVTLPSSGLADGYLFLWGFEFEDTSNGRHNPQGRMVQSTGTGTMVSAQTGGYNRDNSEDRSYVSGWSFVDSPSVSSTYAFQWKRDADTPSGGTVRSFIQVAPFYYSDIGLYTSSTAAVYGGTTPNLMTGFSGTDGTNITISSDQISLTGDNKRYLALGSAFQEEVSNGTRTQRWYGLEVDGAFDDAAKTNVYYRNGSNNQSGGSFIRLLETDTATRTIEMNGYRGDGVAAGEGGADVDGGGTPINGAHALVVLELHDSAEVFSSVDSVGAQEFALTGPVDVDIASTSDIEFNDSASFTRSTDTAVNVEQAMDLFAFTNIGHARGASSIGSGARWTVHGEFTINGTEQTDAGFHGNYNRGNQGSADTHGSSCNQAGFFSVAANDDFGVSQQELAGTEGGGGDIESQAGWVGFGLINLDTLEESGSDTEVSTNLETLTLSESQSSVSLDRNVSTSSENLSLITLQASVSLIVDVQAAAQSLFLSEHAANISVDTEVSTNLEALSLFEYPASVSQGTNISAETFTLSLSELPATVSVDTEVSASSFSMSLSEIAALVSRDVDIQTSLDTLGLISYPAGISSDVQVQAGQESLNLTTYQSFVQLAPRVWLNTSQSLSGATEMTVQGWSTDGTSITFDDPVGSPTGSGLWLGVENTSTGGIGWIQVTVTTGGVNVTTGSVAMSLAENSCTVSLDREVVTSSVDLALSENSALVAVDTEVQCGIYPMSTSTNAASVIIDVAISANSESMVLTENSSGVTLDVDVLSIPKELSIVTHGADIRTDVEVLTQSNSLVLTTYPVSLTEDQEIVTNLLGLALTEYPVTVGLNYSVTTGPASLVLTEHAASIDTGLGLLEELYYNKLGELGFKGNLNDRQSQYMESLSYVGAETDTSFERLRDLGYTGSREDMLKQKATAEGYKDVSKMWKEWGLIEKQ